MSSISAVTVWGERLPKGRYLDNRSQVSELSNLLLDLRRGKKYELVRFSNSPLRYLFLNIILPVLVKILIITSFYPSLEVVEVRMLALY